jgi:drug/metabolite transporter (DMT)-like permease
LNGVVAIVIALGCAVVYGVGDWCGGRASRHQASIVVALLGQLVSLVLVGFVVVAMHRTVPSFHDWLWAGAGGVVGAVGLISLYHGLANGDITVVAPVSAVMGASLPVVVGLLQGERPSALQLVGVALGVAAIALVSGAVGGHRHNTRPRIIALALLSGTCFGLLYVAFQHTASDSGMWPLFIARLTSVPLLVLLVRLSAVRVSRHRASVLIAIAAGALDMGANALYLIAVRQGLLSVVAVIASLYPASTVLLAFLIDRERVSRWQAIGLAVGVGALALVSAA